MHPATPVAATFGRQAEQILSIEQAEKCDLIAMATHGQNVVGWGLLGSVTDRVVHLATPPVLTNSPVRAEKHTNGVDQIRNIIVPLDGSELGESTLSVLEGLAAAMPLQVHLVRAFDPAEYDRRYRNVLALAGITSVNVNQQTKAHHKGYLESVAEGLVNKGLDLNSAEVRLETPHQYGIDTSPDPCDSGQGEFLL